MYILNCVTEKCYDVFVYTSKIHERLSLYYRPPKFSIVNFLVFLTIHFSTDK